MKLFVGYCKAPEQPQSSDRPICQSHTMASMAREPATICIVAYRNSTCYALYHGRTHIIDMKRRTHIKIVFRQTQYEWICIMLHNDRKKYMTE